MPETPEDRSDAASDGGRKRRMFGKYEVKRLIGKGGMGSVHLATDTELKRTVALKILSKDRAQKKTLVQRFKAEGQAAALLNHENITRVYEAGEINGQLYMALEYVDGTDAHRVLQKRGAMPVKRSIEVVRGVVRALEHAAGHGIVHRDIKPANLLIKPDGTVKLADMGLARSLAEEEDAGITRAGTTVGTVDFMSPEQARDSKSADFRSDLYSLGATWYQLLTTEVPFPDGDLTNKLRQHALAPRPDPSALNGQIPEEVSAVLMRMMAVKPEDRYATADALLADLEGLGTTRSDRITTILSDDSSGEFTIGAVSDGPGADGGRPSEKTRTVSARVDSEKTDLSELFEELPEPADSDDVNPVRPPPAPAERSKRGNSNRPSPPSPGAIVPPASSETVPASAAPKSGRKPRRPKPKRAKNQRRSSTARATPESTPEPEDSGDGFAAAAVGEGPRKRQVTGAKRSQSAARSSESPSSATVAVPKGKSREKSKPRSRRSARASLPPRSDRTSSLATGSTQSISVRWKPIAVGLVVSGLIGAAAVVVPRMLASDDPESSPDVPPPVRGVVAADDGTDPAAEDDANEGPTPAGPNVRSGLPSEFALLSEDEFRRLKDLPPLARRSGAEVPPWAEVERLQLDRPSNVITVRSDPVAEGGDSVADLAEAFRKLPASGGSIVLKGVGPYYCPPTGIRSAARLDIRGDGTARPVVYFDSPTPGGDSRAAWLDAENCRLSLNGIDIVAGPNAGSDGTSLIRVQRGTLTVINCSITSLGQSGVTALEVTGNAGPLTSRAVTGRLCTVDSAFYSAAITAVETDARGFDVVLGNCYVGSGESPAIRLNARSADADTGSGRLTVVGSTLVSGAEAILLTPLNDGAVVEASVWQSLLAMELGGKAPAVRVDDPEALQMNVTRSILTGWSELAVVADEPVASPADWSARFGSPIQTQQIHDTALPAAGVGGQAPADLTPRWIEAVDTKVGYDVLMADAARIPTPPGGAVRRLVARPSFPDVVDADQRREPSTGRYEGGGGDSLVEFIGTVPDRSVIELPAGEYRLPPVEIREKTITLRGVEGSVTIEPQRPRRGEMKTPFVIGDGGSLRLEDLSLLVPPDAERVRPPSLVRLNGGTLEIDRSVLADRTGGRGVALVTGFGSATVTRSLLAGGGTGISGDGGPLNLSANEAGIAATTALDGSVAAVLRHSTVLGDERIAGRGPSVWSEGTAFAGRGAVAAEVTPRWFGNRDAFADTLHVARRDGPPVPMTSDSIWRQAIGPFAAVSAVAGGDVLANTLPPTHQVEWSDLISADRVAELGIGADASAYQTGRTRSTPRRRSNELAF